MAWSKLDICLVWIIPRDTFYPTCVIRCIYEAAPIDDKQNWIASFERLWSDFVDFCFNDFRYDYFQVREHWAGLEVCLWDDG